MSRDWHLLWNYGLVPTEELPRGSCRFDRPKSARFTAAGTVLVADVRNRRVVEVDTSGRELRTMTTTSDGRPFRRPTYVVETPSGSWLVVDTALESIEERAPCGGGIRCLTMARAMGSPKHVELLSNGRWLVASAKGVFELDPISGVFELVPGSDSLSRPRAVTRVGNGHTIVSDANDHVVVEFDGHGRRVWTYGVVGEPGPEPGHLFSPCGIQALDDGAVLISDSGNHRIIEVTHSGAIRWSYGRPTEPGFDDGRAWGPRWAERNKAGHTLVTSTSNQCVTLVAGDVARWTIGAPAAGLCLLNDPRSAVRGPEGRILVSDTRSNRVVEIGRTGSRVLHRTPNGSREALWWPRHATYDGSFVCVADGRNNRVVWFDDRGALVREWTQAGGVPFRDPHHVHRIRSGYLITDTKNNRVVNLDCCGELRWECRDLLDPHAAISAGDEVWVADSGRSRIVRINSSGTIKWDSSAEPKAPSLDRPRMLQPMGSAVLVVDTEADRIVFLRTKDGSQMGAVRCGFTKPRYAQLEADRLLVADFGNNRVVELGTFSRP